MSVQKPNGFSLMEVMFAVMILTLGLVFVACQFPVALSVCRDVVDNTREVVESHNSQMMIELKLREVNLEMIVDRRPASIDPGNLHMLLKPNVLVDTLEVVVDDMEVDDNGYNYVEHLIIVDLDYTLANIDLPFWSRDLTNSLDYLPLTNVYLGDIGYTMSPPVDESDPKVEQLINSGWALEQAIYVVSLQRKYSWCAFYREPDDRYNSIEYYIVTLRNSSRDVRYAVQTTKSFVFQGVDDPLFVDRPLEWPIEGMVGPADDDRLFPVPWRVFLDDEALINGTWYYWGQTPNGLIPANQQPPAVFSVRPAVGMLLRTGSILIDADPPDGLPPANFARVAGGSGNIYEVAKVEAEKDVVGNIIRYWITLRTSLADDDLFSFWFFPPPVLRDKAGNFVGFDDFQPVVNVTKKIIKFD